MDNKLVSAAINLLEARANRMVTAEEWEALAQAVKEETGHYIQWRNWDELKAECYHGHVVAGNVRRKPHAN